MRFPSKLFQYKETVIYDCSVIMETLECETSVLDLYKACRNKCNSVQGFLDALDVLYALRKIDYDKNARRIINVTGNNL